MATSPNYAWAEPDNSSLVKNGASDIRTLGDAIDTSVWNVGFGQAGKNKIINGDFNINQRNFTSVTATSTFTFDRFSTTFSGGTVTYTPQTFTVGTAPVSGYESTNFLRIVTASQSVAGDYAGIVQPIEDVRTFAGKTVTFSFWAKASSGTPNIGASIQQAFGTGGSSTVVASAAVQAITSSWARYSFTINVPSISGKTIGTNNSLRPTIWTSVGTTLSGLGYPAVGVQNVTIDIWGVQVETGSKATPFQTATGTIQGELAACKYYYQRISSDATSSIAAVQLAFANSTTSAMSLLPIATMRTTPSVGYSAVGNFYLSDLIASANYTTTAIAISGIRSTNNVVFITHTVASGLTSGRAYSWQANTTSTYFDLSAEL